MPAGELVIVPLPDPARLVVNVNVSTGIVAQFSLE
jgi:hypothetical protein